MLNADNTHLYPGARLAVYEDATLPDSRVEAVVLFRDDSSADAVLMPSEDGLALYVESYSTAAGTGIDAKNWVLQAADDRSLVVKRRADV